MPSRHRAVPTLVVLASVVASGVVALLLLVHLESKSPRSLVVRVSANNLVDSSGRPVRLLGVDLSGTEDACVLGRSYSWGPLDRAEARTVASWGSNAVRVPLNEDCWLGINGAPIAYSAASYRAVVEHWVSDLNRAGLIVILDLHWSAPGSILATQQWPMPDVDHSVTFWTQVASTFASDPSVIFDLFNEPHAGSDHPTVRDWECWRNGCADVFRLCGSPSGRSRGASCRTIGYRAAGMQRLVKAVRDTGAHQPIMVAGLDWAGEPCRTRGGVLPSGSAGTGCMWTADRPSDPEHQLVVSFHAYNTAACNSPVCWNRGVSALARTVPVVIGEFGETDCSARFDLMLMRWADSHHLSYLAWSWDPTSRSQTCSSNNLRLLGNWNGRPASASPAGAAVLNHLRAQRRLVDQS